MRSQNFVKNVGSECGSDTCTKRQKLLPNGKCDECPSYTKVSKNGKDCDEEACNNRQKLKSDGYCELCPPYFHVDKAVDKTKCVMKTCAVKTEFVTTDARCEPCPTYKRAFFGDGTTCESDKCNDREQLQKDGTCKNCGDYKRASKDNLMCISDPCNPD